MGREHRGGHGVKAARPRTVNGAALVGLECAPRRGCAQCDAQRVQPLTTALTTARMRGQGYLSSTIGIRRSRDYMFQTVPTIGSSKLVVCRLGVEKHLVFSFSTGGV